MELRTLIEVLFWSALGVTLYVYVGYPALLAAWARLAPKPVLRSAVTPGVSIVIAARNEAADLQARIENLLASDYPADRMQIIVVSDGSTDATPDILGFYRAQIDAVLLPPGGKAQALNAGVERAIHDVLVFTDARQTFAPDALRALACRSAGRRRLRRAPARLRVRRRDVHDRRGRRRLLALREVAAPAREPDRLDARLNRGDSCAAP
jgi:cellulose synthase/poly-beta-1,6-N-acetylglucosamine synthase-like glycosyltransferase